MAENTGWVWCEAAPDDDPAGGWREVDVAGPLPVVDECPWCQTTITVVRGELVRSGGHQAG